MKLFTVESIFKAELEEKQSRFIAHLVPYSEFEVKLADLRRQGNRMNKLVGDK